MTDLFDQDFTRTHTHSGGASTETEAADKASRGAPNMKERIIHEMTERGNFSGLTPHEFSEETGSLIVTVRRRFTDLWKEGKIMKHPGEISRPNLEGNQSLAWIIGEDPDRKPSRIAILQEQRKRLRECLKRVGNSFPISSHAIRMIDEALEQTEEEA